MPAIIDYRLDWHPGLDQGVIRVRVEGNPNLISLPINSAVEFVAVATMLRGGSVTLNPDGSLSSGS